MRHLEEEKKGVDDEVFSILACMRREHPTCARVNERRNGVEEVV
jgi:hypothetical protein